MATPKPQSSDLATIMGRWDFLQQSRDISAFLELCTAAYDEAPEDPEIGAQYGEALGFSGRVKDKVALLHRLLEAEPKSVILNTNLGLELLIQGRYRDAWPYFAYRVGKQNTLRKTDPLDPKHRWRGEKLDGKRMVLISEQGLGDTLQFARYAIDLHLQGARSFLNVHPPLRALLGASPSVGTVLTPDIKVEIHHWIPMLDLVPVFTHTARDIRWPGAYISPPAADRPFTGLGNADGLRVGLVWQGNPKFRLNYARSVGLAALEPLREAGNCRFFSLMAGEAAKDLAASDQSTWIRDLSAETTPFERLAQAVASLDVVVTVCTSIAHLAGAMGKPVFLILSAMPDWRWGREGRTTPWYPSMRLYRQRRFGDWSEVVRDVARDLSAL